MNRVGLGPSCASVEKQPYDLKPRCCNRLYGIGQYSSSFLTSIKTSLKYIGICEDALALPFGVVEQTDRDTIRRHLVSLGLMPDGKAVSTKHH